MEEAAGICCGVQMGDCAANDNDSTGFQSCLFGRSVKYRNIFLQQFLIMVFFMVLTLVTTEKPAPILDFSGLFTIEWE